MVEQVREQDRISLLLVEDEAVDAGHLTRLLEGPRSGFTTSRVKALSDALTRGPGEFDVALVAMRLGDPGALDALSACIDAWEGRPVLVISNSSDRVFAEEVLRRGAQDCLVLEDINGRAIRRATHYAFERHRIAEERNLLAKELEQSRKLEAIGQLAAGVAHEINTPTQYVSDNTRFLRDAVRDLVAAASSLNSIAKTGRGVSGEELAKILADADIDYLLTELPRAVDQSLDGLAHIARIVRAMKEFSHPASGEKAPTDLNHALETTILVASNEWKYVATIETDLDAELPAVECLAGEMNQVFLNLIVNAAHAVGDVVGGRESEKGTIRISTRRVGEDSIEVAISDSGSGISEADREKIFEPFFTTKEVGRGTGQGLAIAHSVVVRKHGGRLEFDTQVGRGTTFRVLLPVRGQADDVPTAA